MKQQELWKTRKDTRHGGHTRSKKRKTARPIVTKSPMHVTFKSGKARGAWSLLRNAREVEATVQKTAKRYRVQIRRYENVGNHLHLVTQATTRQEFQTFLRVLPQAVMFLVTGAKKGNPQGRFWDGLAFTRVVRWGKDWENIKSYLEKNRLEAAGAPRASVDRIFAEAEAAFRNPDP